MATLFQAAKLLEIPTKDRAPTSAVEYVDHVARGLPLRSLDRIAAAIAPNDAGFRYRIVPKATLARLTAKRRLNKVQGEVVTRLAEVWTDALRVWKTDDAARDFLNRGHPLLDGQRPIDLTLASALGAELVRDILGRLEHGSAV